MTFFDWRAAPEEGIVKSLWLDFAVAVPLTILVMVLDPWTRWTREKNRARLSAEENEKALKIV